MNGAFLFTWREPLGNPADLLAEPIRYSKLRSLLSHSSATLAELEEQGRT
ncbi:protein of unknown function [Brevefilum fermentans]|uniref:Uncharacterized protein n=1 Tax=Candidatus Brevifilum fermentans TaxID=1986204 RepID=A0A1Y6K0W2_9CHLR|nr:protein of unknown function [Brevefilum fermentans]